MMQSQIFISLYTFAKRKVSCLILVDFICICINDFICSKNTAIDSSATIALRRFILQLNASALCRYSIMKYEHFLKALIILISEPFFIILISHWMGYMKCEKRCIIASFIFTFLLYINTFRIR